ncbi:MAG TPA: acyl carrier protein [Bacteroidia bacterium]|jgi:acyl carrier protein|nr:acyl carrier protein [Bacteroidia bacterium]
MDDALKELNTVFARVFRKPELVITYNSDAASVEGWDSLTHMMLIAAIEKQFNVLFTLGQVMHFRNAGDILAAIETNRT